MAKTPDPLKGPANTNPTDWRKWLVRGGIAVGVIVIAVFFAGTEGGQNDVAPEGVTEFPLAEIGREHVDGAVAYDLIPPPGGDHNAAWLNCGTYSTPVAPENAVHSLEHGAVWVAYNPDIGQDQIDELAGLGSNSVIVSPVPGLDTPIAAAAWGARQTFDNAGDPDIRQFIRFYQSAPYAPEPGAACVGGVGTPG
ncbi:MAG: DUF3105 domain-containing protein [Acidimicrobiia bacterium]|nr:DUF3105 domain-containing protein [Acidimicrobiia bacterium]